MRAIAAVVAGSTMALALAACAGPPVSDLKVGDCFVQAALASEVDSVPTVPCTDPHDAEVYAIIPLDNAEFDQDVIDTAATDGCEAQYEGYLGIPYWDSQYLFLSLTPTEDGWRTEATHNVICFVWPGEGVQLYDTVKGSRD